MRPPVPMFALFALAAGALVVIGCSSGLNRGHDASGPVGSPEVVVSPKPPGVSGDARLVESDYNLATGSGVSMAPGPASVFYALRCRSDVLVIATTAFVAYADLPCDRAPTDEIVRPFLAHTVQLRVKAGTPAKLFVDSATAGSIEFTVGSVWIQELSP